LISRLSLTKKKQPCCS